MLIRPIENSIARNSFILPPFIATKKSVHLNLRRDQNERSNLIIQFWLLSDKLESRCRSTAILFCSENIAKRFYFMICQNELSLITFL